mmetsp:Transcript_27448/g.56254  ORF Transcript_27448/g.56254 Transcript_27448/m.56254 type:complete len:361 (+) Transcript_27448:119-1201(+)
MQRTPRRLKEHPNLDASKRLRDIILLRTQSNNRAADPLCGGVPGQIRGSTAAPSLRASRAGLPLHERVQDRSLKIRRPTGPSLLFSDTSLGLDRATKKAEQAESKKHKEEEQLVQLVGDQIQPKVGLSVYYSRMAIEEYHRVQKVVPGTITEVDNDKLMCTITWADGEQDYCPTGYKGKYFLISHKEKVAVWVQAQDYLVDALVSPRFQLDEELHTWRLKSLFKDHRTLADKDRDGKLYFKQVVLPQVKKELKMWEQQRLEAEAEEEKKKGGRGSPLQSPRKLLKRQQTNIGLDSPWRQKHFYRDRVLGAVHGVEGMDNDTLDAHISVILAQLKDTHTSTAANLYEDGLPMWMLRSRNQK